MRRFQVLDSWRGVSAIAVVLYHFPPIFYFADSGLVRSSGRFVDFFFVLSGFVITHGYADKISSAFALREFVIRRFLRLYPLHFFTFAVFVLWIILFDTSRALLATRISGFHLTNLFSEFSTERVIAHLALMQGFLGEWQNIGFNVPSWSISVEFWTYIVFAAVCVVWRKALLPLHIVIAAAALWLLYADDGLGAAWYGNFVRSLAGFSIGSACYLFLRNRAISAPHQVMTIIEIVSISGALGYLWLFPREGLMWLAPLVFVQMVAVFSFQQGAVSTFLLRPVFRRAGLHSYSIYMNHVFMIGLIKIALDAMQRLTGFDASAHLGMGSLMLAMTLCSVWWVSGVTHRLIELPWQRFTAPSRSSLSR